MPKYLCSDVNGSIEIDAPDPDAAARIYILADTWRPECKAVQCAVVVSELDADDMPISDGRTHYVSLAPDAPVLDWRPA